MDKKLNKSEFMALAINHYYDKKANEIDKENMVKEHVINTSQKIRKRIGRKKK